MRLHEARHVLNCPGCTQTLAVPAEHRHGFWQKRFSVPVSSPAGSGPQAGCLQVCCVCVLPLVLTRPLRALALLVAIARQPDGHMLSTSPKSGKVMCPSDRLPTERKRKMLVSYAGLLLVTPAECWSIFSGSAWLAARPWLYPPFCGSFSLLMHVHALTWCTVLGLSIVTICFYCSKFRRTWSRFWVQIFTYCSSLCFTLFSGLQAKISAGGFIKSTMFNLAYKL